MHLKSQYMEDITDNPEQETAPEKQEGQLPQSPEPPAAPPQEVAVPRIEPDERGEEIWKRFP